MLSVPLSAFPALADVLKACLRDNLAAMGAGLGTLVAAYYDGCLTHRQCLHIACCMIKTLNTWSQAQGKGKQFPGGNDTIRCRGSDWEWRLGC